MKHYLSILTIAILVASAGISSAQKIITDTRALENARAGFLMALKSSNEGLVESTIFNTLKFGLYYPEQDLSDLIEELNRILLTAENPSIRFKSHLVVSYLTNPGLMEKIEKKNYSIEQSHELYARLAEMMKDSYLVLSGPDK